MTDKLVESIREHHKRQGHAPHVCTECRLPWPCEALVAAQRIEAALAHATEVQHGGVPFDRMVAALNGDADAR